VPLKLTLQEIADACQGKIFGDESLSVDGVSIDTRTLQKGDLFVPLIAERDGHEYVREASQIGAKAHLFSHGSANGNAIHVEDTLKAFQDLAKYARTKIQGEVIGITGSVGKTTTKDILFAALSDHYPTKVSKFSHNNEIGVPLTLLSSDDSTKHVVLEMGARGPGQIRELCEIASPSIGLVTQVSAAHTEFFANEEEIALTKGELIESLPESGTAILNAEDERVLSMASRTNAEVVTFGFYDADVLAENILMDENICASFTLRTPWGIDAVKLNIPGVHNISNALAAVSAGLTIGLNQSSLVDSLSKIELSPMRMDLRRTNSGTLVINDSYNANPASMNAAIDTLISVDAKTRIAVLGLMAELGDRSAAEHRKIANRLEKSGTYVISVGVKEYGGVQVTTWEEALEKLHDSGLLGDNSVVLIKGSRVAGLDKVAEALHNEIR